MTVNRVVKTAAATNTDMDNATLNPDIQATGQETSRNRKIIHLTLVCEGVTVDPDNIYDALDTQFATVSGEKDTFSRGCWIFNIGPA